MIRNKNCKIRLFRSTDVNQVVKINYSCLPENYNESFFLDLFYRYPKTFLVSICNGLVVGYIMCRIELGFSEIRRFNIIKKGHIVSIAVLSECRMRGIGRALVDEALKGMKEYNVKECYLEVRVNNISAINLYRKLGFKVVKRNYNYYKDGEEAYTMAWESF